MRRPVRVLVRAVVPATAALVVVLVLAPGRAELAVHVYVLVLLAVGLAVAVAAISSVQSASASAFDRALRSPRAVPERLPELARLEREAALAQSSAFDLHYRLRPVLREIAAGLLAWRHGVDLDRDPDRASALLGPDAWQIVRPDRPPPHDRLGRGIDAETLGRVVASLEAL